ncbi:hypothetical protein P3T76_009261 [Phytophthora citrophthora]|uniref:Protein kinase domain-containing protein n=1 Tax=Phytophthora citrophthora TaxID=4793 RepID=A0AAD9GGL1_9STRA|nr:hypothetical protein P3T76_009261 [Phytophthora citrophthora]
MKERDEASWFLIDFAVAATSPQPSATGEHLSLDEHAPEIFVENGEHTTAVDIWAVGFLIESCELENSVNWLDFGGRSVLYKRKTLHNDQVQKKL